MHSCFLVFINAQYERCWNVWVSQTFTVGYAMKIVHHIFHSKGSTATATATKTVPSWMGSVQTNRGVHMVTDGNGNSIIVKWVVDLFFDGNGNKKNQYEIHTYATFLLSLLLLLVTMWTPLLVCTEPIHERTVSIHVENPLCMNR